ncbi:urease accessory protein UreD [Methylobacterium sp. Leaf456]|uniref:urease accessory protein UreD n=1 Tax=Methylobacterium sp. Leaf456 TaxID=1736382 RepID=UPI0007015CD4|nr:urease accessory protein UreD [Methylobacterium sp. Leaf456]KQT60761.1 urease accessory protein UreD [Methylobacterium sp. Leaf456]
MHAFPAPPAPPSRQRSRGHVDLHVGPAAANGPTRLRDIAESGPSRLRFPRQAGTMEGILVNTAGGIACGDDFCVSVRLDPGADLVLTTVAAEKVYRSDGPVSHVRNRLDLGEGAHLAWLPQETILFDRARLKRSFEADLAADSALLVAEIVAFGRAARGETLEDVLFEDIWRVRRAQKLVYADTLRLEGPVSALLARAAIGGGARAMGTILDCSPGAEGRIEEARACLDAAGPGLTEAAASAWNGHLIVRLLGPEVGALRELAARFLTAYRGLPMPRVWQS